MLVWIVSFMLLATGVEASSAFDRPVSTKGETFSEAEKNFLKVKEMLLKRFVDPSLKDDQLWKAATQGMLASLNTGNENWNRLLSPSELEDMEGDLKGEVAGIGVEIDFDSKSGISQVVGLISGSPALEAGLKVGDQILLVDGKNYRGREFRDLVFDIRGKVGSSVKLKILRGEEVLTKSVTRKKISWTPVESLVLQVRGDEKVGLLIVRYFSENTPSLIREALEKMLTEKVTGLVIDLRDNSGGLFDKAVESAKWFVPRGSTVVQVEDREKKTELLKSDRDPLIKGLPVVLLTNARTGSGAELFAAALAENLGSKIVGEKTLGKWNAQTVERLNNRYAVKFTTENFKSPLGNSHGGVGLKPDLEVAGEPTELVRRMKRPSEMKERVEADPKLRAAINLIHHQ